MTDDAAYRDWLDGVLQRYRQLGFFTRGEYAGLAGAALREAVVGLDAPVVAVLRQWGWSLEMPASYGVLADPELEAVAPSPDEGELYTQRGLWRHAHGDYDGAYRDWAVARQVSGGV